MDEHESNISNLEWGLIIGALAVVDGIQILLDLLLQVGVIANRFIDIFVGMAFAFYLQMRGESLANNKRLFGLVATFFAEEIPDLDALPFWCLDGIYNMMISKAEEKARRASKIYDTAEKFEQAVVRRRASQTPPPEPLQRRRSAQTQTESRRDSVREKELTNV